MDREQIILAIEAGGCSSKVFADGQLRAKEIRVNGEKESAALSSSVFISAVLALPAFAGAISISSVMAPVTVIAVGLSMAWAIGEHLTKTAPAVERATELDLLLSDATPEEWAVLAELCGSPEDLMGCFRAGIVAGNQRSSEKGKRYHAALVHAHGLGKVLPSEFEPPAKTGFGAPKSLPSWRETPKDEPESLPTNAEIALVIRLCGDRAGVKAVASKIVALRDAGNVQAALNLAITHAGISDRDYVKAGVAITRLRAIKKWAAEGDMILIEPTKPIEVPVLESAQVVAQKPIAVATPFVPVEIEEVTEEDEDEEEDDDDDPIVIPTVPAIVVDQPAARPAIMSSSIRKNTGAGTAKDLIDALLKEAYRSTALIGGERSGKTYLAAIFSNRLKAERKTTITYINLFDANGDSASDWEHADHVITANLNDDRCDVQRVLDKVYARLRQFQKETNTHLYFDEWVATTSRSNAWEKKAAEDIRRANSMSGQGEFLEPEGIGTSAVELMNLMSAVASELSNIGKKQLKAMWLISPALRAGDIYEQGKVMKSLAPAIVIIPPGKAIEWVHPSGIVQEIGFDLARYQVSEVNLAIPKSYTIPNLDCDRAVFIGGQWYSLDGLNDQKPKLSEPIQRTIEQTIDLDEAWDDEDDVIEPAIVSSVNTETLDEIASRIMAMTKYSMKARLQMIEDAQHG